MLVLLLVWGCSEKWNGVDPNAVGDFEITGLTLDNFPFMDCSTSTSPLRDMGMYNLLDIPYGWGMNVVTGSQYEIFFRLPEGMETLVMEGLKMIDNPVYMGGAMLSPYLSIEMDPCGLGYTPYYFCESMVPDLHAVRVIAVDGAYPTSETIMKAVKGEKGAYPYFSNIYAAIRSDESDNSLSRQIYKWLSTPRAKDIIDESGYISIR